MNNVTDSIFETIQQHNPITARELAEAHDLTEHTVRYHLGMLRSAGMVTGERGGPNRGYRPLNGRSSVATAVKPRIEQARAEHVAPDGSDAPLTDHDDTLTAMLRDVSYPVGAAIVALFAGDVATAKKVVGSL